MRDLYDSLFHLELENSEVVLQHDFNLVIPCTNIRAAIWVNGQPVIKKCLVVNGKKLSQRAIRREQKKMLDQMITDLDNCIFQLKTKKLYLEKKNK